MRRGRRLRFGENQARSRLAAKKNEKGGGRKNPSQQLPSPGLTSRLQGGGALLYITGTGRGEFSLETDNHKRWRVSFRGTRLGIRFPSAADSLTKASTPNHRVFAVPFHFLSDQRFGLFLSSRPRSLESTEQSVVSRSANERIRNLHGKGLY